MTEAPGRFVIVGANYGRVYVDAIRLAGHCVVGLMSRGSARSRAVAVALDLPYVEAATSMSGLAEFACVATPGDRSTLEVAERLAEQGLHLLIEHPVSGRAMRDLMKLAARTGRRIFVNAAFGDFPAVQTFLALTAGMALTAKARAAGTCTVRTLYGALDILFRALGPEGWQVSRWVLPQLVHVHLARPGATISLVVETHRHAIDDGSDQILPVQLMLTDGAGAVHLPDIFIHPFRAPTIAGLVSGWGPPGTRGGEVQDVFSSRTAANVANVRALLSAARGGAAPFWQDQAYLEALAAAFDAARGSAGRAGGAERSASTL